MRFRTCLLALCAVAASAVSASAQQFPDRILKLVVPQPPGGGFDLVGRVMAEKLAPILGQSVVVENRTGSGTLVGTDAVAKAAPDGYTMLVGALPNLVLNVGLYPKLPYDPVKDFAPVGMVVSYGYALVSRPDLPHKDVKALFAFAKANPEKLIYASGGRGTGQHIALAVTENLAGVKMTHVPYRGAQAAYQDVLGGRIDLFFDNVSTALPLIEGNRVGVLATSGKKRHPRLQQVPTLIEAGLGNFDMESWFGVFVPAGVAKPALDKLQAAVKQVVTAPGFAETFTKTGGIAMNMTPVEIDAMLKADIAKWTKLLKDASVTVE